MWKRAISSSSSNLLLSFFIRYNNGVFSFLPRISLPNIPCSFPSVLPKVFVQDPPFGPLLQIYSTAGRGFHSSMSLDRAINDSIKQSESSSTTPDASTKVKRKKLKGKRAVVRWLKHFRWKKKKELQRMTAEEKILYKLKKAHKKEERLIKSLKKLEPKEWSEAIHDPEILTPEEHFYYLKMGLKCKNYVPVGRRGIYQGVILNMHLHWKKHQTLQVIVKTFTPQEVKEIAAELARLTGGIVLDIHDENTIIMYRGKNYMQPPTEIMSPRVTLPRKKALDKSKYRDSLRAVRRYIPRLEQELELLKVQTGNKEDHALEKAENDIGSPALPVSESVPSDKLRELMDQYDRTMEGDDPFSDTSMNSDSEDLSDMFETDSDSAENVEQSLYLNEFDKIPAKNSDPGKFVEDLCRMSLDSKKDELTSENADMADFDEIDQVFLQAAELLKKKKRR
ncbi:uncharacterized CRM domain-containing protein At3g25440, chloroplastic isoform X1 [Amaranthus tricolor]|uniref:uncharacterized CRM domain-containing protein At3g25440, chloroplastic isoform X1 n=1 Tax=Amaranthus tricolor TaxID=29722 RepID=UPI00258F48AA|nr:uncharacterized CRM domain-containing protein At3g25440, chloroplastic isoform X1 [Amaranthus tricolor]XP_057527655.1 uncharacterized CRM domain-containing protein At3g25440, chloroplastic isoform X1 [Amaranthus tricolor]XP_057527656.1 uncharacterized CRM domain-containing protein At3g25440, chloroplastic isoform X1 [Amaranthus tricolor]